MQPVSAVGEADIDTLFAKALAALVPGGVLLLHDFMLNNAADGPDLAAHWFLLNLALNSHGASFSAAELVPRLERAGFGGVESREHIHDITGLVIAHKPA